MNTNPTDAFPASLPPTLAGLVSGYDWRRVTIGCSAASVYYLHVWNRPGMYLKKTTISGGYSLDQERQRLEWLDGRLPVPRVLCFMCDDEAEYLLLSEVAGRPSHILGNQGPPERVRQSKEQTVRLLADGLRMIHALPILECPFQRSTHTEIEEARQRMKKGLVDEDDFDRKRRGRSAEELFDELLQTIPCDEDLVFTHGDYCLPNIIIDGGAIGGFIDVGRAGIGDRWRDLALAARSLRHNYGTGWEHLLFDSYGIDRVEGEKMEFFQLLDEFF